MKRKNHIHIIDKRDFLVILLLGVFSQASADKTLGANSDCSEVSINYTDNPEWTHIERLEAMDIAFFESVSRFELCNLSNQSNQSSSSSSVESGSTQVTNAGSDTGESSVASQEMTGTGTETDSTQPADNVSDAPSSSNNTDSQTVKVNTSNGKNGARPKDIPVTDNDDVIAAQIRLAAEIEKNPEKKQKLWNEYRKYKGIAVNENQ